MFKFCDLKASLRCLNLLRMPGRFIICNFLLGRGGYILFSARSLRLLFYRRPANSKLVDDSGVMDRAGSLFLSFDTGHRLLVLECAIVPALFARLT